MNDEAGIVRQFNLFVLSLSLKIWVNHAVLQKSANILVSSKGDCSPINWIWVREGYIKKNTEGACQQLPIASNTTQVFCFECGKLMSVNGETLNVHLCIIAHI